MRRLACLIVLMVCVLPGCSTISCYADVSAHEERLQVLTTCNRPCTLSVGGIEYSPDAAGHVHLTIPEQLGGCTQVTCGITVHDGSPYRRPLVVVRLGGDSECVLSLRDIEALPTNAQGEHVLELECSHWSHDDS